MSIELDHIIIPAHDQQASAASSPTSSADPGYQQPGRINHRRGGRGVYFHDPNGHSMELLTSTAA